MFVDIGLETFWYVRQLKSPYLLLKIIVLHTEDYFLFIFFMYFHQMIYTRWIKLDKTLGANLLIQRLSNQKSQISIFDGEVIELLLINIQSNTNIKLLNKKDGNIYKDFGILDEVIS